MVAIRSSPAKINLFLNVTGQRPDGFHDLVSVFFRLPHLADTLIISPETDQPGIQLTCSDVSLASPDNVVVKAYNLFYQAYSPYPPIPLNVHLNKVIPLQAGLGGGSSNAATLLHYLASAHHIALNDDRLRAVAARVGSDVPFFLSGHPVALVRGKGEHIEPIAVHPDNAVLTRPWLVVQPPSGMPTPLAYQRLRERNVYKTEPVEPLLSRLSQPGPDTQGYFLNDFELANSPTSDMAHIWQVFMALGCQRPLLCGSGSAVAGLIQPVDPHTLQQQMDEAFSPGWFWHYVPPPHG